MCGKDVLSKDKRNHENMHDKHKKQLKGLAKGKVTKTRTKTKTTGYNVFVKEKFAEIAQEQPELSNADIMKLVGGR